MVFSIDVGAAVDNTRLAGVVVILVLAEIYLFSCYRRHPCRRFAGVVAKKLISIGTAVMRWERSREEEWRWVIILNVGEVVRWKSRMPWWKFKVKSSFCLLFWRILAWLRMADDDVGLKDGESLNSQLDQLDQLGVAVGATRIGDAALVVADISSVFWVLMGRHSCCCFWCRRRGYRLLCCWLHYCCCRCRIADTGAIITGAIVSGVVEIRFLHLWCCRKVRSLPWRHGRYFCRHPYCYFSSSERRNGLKSFTGKFQPLYRRFFIKTLAKIMETKRNFVYEFVQLHEQHTPPTKFSIVLSRLPASLLIYEIFFSNKVVWRFHGAGKIDEEK